VAAFKASKARLDTLLAPRRAAVGAPAVAAETTNPEAGKKLAKTDFKGDAPALRPRTG
jgi:hypothetical protein